MSSKKSRKDYFIPIDSGEEIAHSPHILNLREVKFEKNEFIDERLEIDERTEKVLENNTIEKDTNEKILEEVQEKRGKWYYFKIKLRLFLLSIFEPQYLEPNAMNPRARDSYPRFKELFIVNLVSFIFLIIWKILKLSFHIARGFVNAFISLVVRDEEIDDELPRVCGLHKFRERFLPRSLKMREAVCVFALVAFVIIMPLRLFLTYEGLVEVKKKIMSAGDAALGHITLAFEDETIENPGKVFTKIGAELSFASSQIEEINFFLRNLISILPKKGEQFKTGESLLKTGIELTATVSNVLGINEQKRYLLIFQNNNEIRPTGGFIGSFAEISVRNGEIKKTFFPGGGSYDIDGGLLVKLVPPEPLQLIASRWHFRDANWFPDFPTSAEKIMWFYEKSGGGTVDGVITINASFVENLLELVGPIEMADYGKILTADNFIDEVQRAVEIEYDKEENKPKQILADLMPHLIEKILNISQDEIYDMSRVLSDSLVSRDIQFYFTNKDVEENVLSFGWGGEIKNTSGDYMALFNSNIAGQKTDAVIDEKIEHETRIDKDGNIINTVRITRKHNGIKGDLFTGVRNVNYARLYVPKGSILLKAEGFSAPDPEFFDIIEEGCAPDKNLAELERIVIMEPASGTKVTEEFGKTVFGNWVMVDPGESITYSFTYHLPFRVSFEHPSFFESVFGDNDSPIGSYNLFTQKQSGSKNTEFVHFLRLPENMEEAWQYSSKPGQTNLQKLESDRFYGVLIKK